jgi:3-oxoacyl-[acyl-carrier-protein] synthase II
MSADFEITGTGVVNAAGTTTKAYWEALTSGVSTARQIHLFGPDAVAQTVMPVADDQVEHGWSPRQVKRLDRMTMLSSAAIREALADARLETQPGESDRIGVFVGNATGGWGYVEPQLYPLYRDQDLGAINPYVATAWFPTASQGELSIVQGIGGTSKTFCAENLSAVFALRQACWAIADGTLDVAVVCGVEAPLTPLVYNACIRTGAVSFDGAYHPYSFEGDGAPLGEGAAAIVIEATEHSRERRVRPRARIGTPVLGSDRQSVITRALNEAGTPRVDYVALEARGQTEPDTLELFAVESALAGDLPAMGAATGTSGALLGASFATSLVSAVLAVHQGAIPGGTRVHAALGERVRVEHGATAEEAQVSSALVVGTDTHDQAGAVVVEAVEDLA